MMLLLMCVAFVEAVYLVLVGWMIARTWLRRNGDRLFRYG